MLKGVRSIYVDFVDYDEIAHHAGILRPESLEALEAVDGVLHQLELLASAAPRKYRFVILSDHGQAQGAIFADRYGEDLASLVARLARSDVASSDGSVEGWGRTRALVGELASPDGVGGRAMQSAANAMDKDDRNEPDAVAATPATRGAKGRTEPATGDETFHVFGSGNLGLIYVRGEKAQLTRRELSERYPGLVAGLAAHPGVGFVVVMDDDGPVALGSDGWHRLDDGHVEGVDPLLPFGPYAPGSSTGWLTDPRHPTSTSTACWIPAPTRWPPSRVWSAATAASAGGRTAPVPSSRSTCPSPRSGAVGADAMHVALRDILRTSGTGKDHRARRGVFA